MDKEIGKINKGEFQGTTTDIIVAVREYNGKVGLDIREYTTSDKYTGPTKKGLRIPAEHFHEFKKMVDSISDKDLIADDSAPESKENHQEEVSSKKIKTEKPGHSHNEELPDY